MKRRDLTGFINLAVGRQLSKAGFVARDGQIIDASILTAPTQCDRYEENEKITQGEVPEGWSSVKRAQKDVHASWVHKHGKRY